MADTRLSDLSAAGALSASDLFYVVQTPGSGGEKATGAQLLTLVGTTYVPLAGGTMTGALTIDSGTLTASAPALSITQGHNNAAVSFVALQVSITGATVSATNSSLARFENLITSSAFYINKGGDSLQGNTTWAMSFTSAGLGFAASLSAISSPDAILARDAAATLAQRNGTTQQIFRLYNSYTDSSNFERLTLTGVAGTSVNITAETLGTGGDNIDIVLTPAGSGSVKFPSSTGVNSTGYLTISGILAGGQSSVNHSAIGFRTRSNGELAWTSGTIFDAPDTALFRNAAGIVEVNNGTAGTWRDLKLRNLIQTEYSQLTEMTAPAAPAANSVRIYAEDNGAGKTRLMALFATGAAQQIAIEP